MKTLLYIIGVAVGFWLVELAFSLHPAQAKKAAPAEKPASAVSARISAGAKPVAAAPLPDAATPPAPVRTFAQAFWFLLAGMPTILPSDYPAEMFSDPAFAELYHRSLLARAKDRIAPIALALNLNDTQYQALLEIAAEQTRRWHEINRQSDNRGKRDELSAELSRAAETRLATLLTPTQLEQVAQINRSAIPFAAMVEAFALRGAPLAREHAPRLLVPAVQRLGEGTFTVLNPTELDPAAPWLTDDQRRYAAARKRWLAAGELIDTVNSIKVKDPELRDMWPQ